MTRRDALIEAIKLVDALVAKDANQPMGTIGTAERVELILDVARWLTDGWRAASRNLTYQDGFRDGARYRADRIAAGLPVADDEPPRCIKCGRTTGAFVEYLNGYIHAYGLCPDD